MAAPARSTVNLAVLAVVLDMPGHGYDVGRRFEQLYGGLFGSSGNHVYRSLDSLQRKGMVEAAPHAAARVGDVTPLEMRRKSFWRATPEGARTISRWLAAPIPPEDARRELWIRLRAVRADDYDRILEVFDCYEEALLASVGFVRPAAEPSIIDVLAREDQEAFVEGQLRWLAGAREQVHQWKANSSRLS
jgi:DNA-binding PadR family transcriptional regulator